MERPALISGMRACGFKPPSTDLHAPTVTGPPEGVNRTRSASPLRSAPAFAPLKLAPLLDLPPATSAWGATPSMATALKLAPRIAGTTRTALVTPRPWGTSRSAKHRLVIAVVVGSSGLAHRTGRRLLALPDAAGTIADCPPTLGIPSKPDTPVVVEVAGIEPASDMRCGDFIQS